MSGQVFNQDYRIPDKLVGLVIGRGGEQIKRLQQDSQCKIRIASESDGTPERSCTLTGSQEAIENYHFNLIRQARQMLDQVVQRGLSRENNGGFQNNRNGGGGGGYQQRNGGGGGAGGFQNNGGYQNRRN